MEFFKNPRFDKIRTLYFLKIPLYTLLTTRPFLFSKNGKVKKWKDAW